jgi:hypothetical protein
LKNFYARAFVVSFGVGIVWWKTWKYGERKGQFPVYGMHKRINNDFNNYPLLRQLVTGRVINKGINPA